MSIYILSIFTFLTALIISGYSIPVIIKLAFIKKLYDKPGGRKTHKGYVPNLGGMAIFAAFLIAFIGWADFAASATIQYFILGLIILHFVGVKDDILPLNPFKKLIGQLTAAAILVIPGRFRIVDLYGILGFHHLPVLASIGLSIFAVIVIVNSFNLIDGIDGLAAGISLIITLTYGYLFWSNGMHNMFLATVALSGALTSFLFYNRQPARIFMGDAGSMTIGYLMAAFTFQFINIGNEASQTLFHHTPVVVFAFLIIPLFDTLRVFTIRILSRKSPFSADCNHIHHKLLGLGFNHRQTTLILCVVNIVFIGLAYMMRRLGPNSFICVIVLAAMTLTTIPFVLSWNQRRKADNLIIIPPLPANIPSTPNEVSTIRAISENNIPHELNLN